MCHQPYPSMQTLLAQLNCRSPAGIRAILSRKTLYIQVVVHLIMQRLRIGASTMFYSGSCRSFCKWQNRGTVCLWLRCRSWRHTSYPAVSSPSTWNESSTFAPACHGWTSCEMSSPDIYELVVHGKQCMPVIEESLVCKLLITW